MHELLYVNMAGVFDIELHDAENVDLANDSEDDAIEVEEEDFDPSLNFNNLIDEEGIETVQLSEQTVNPGNEKTGPQDFELRKVLGKGGYGKVFQGFTYVAPSVLEEMYKPQVVKARSPRKGIHPRHPFSPRHHLLQHQVSPAGAFGSFEAGSHQMGSAGVSQNNHRVSANVAAPAPSGMMGHHHHQQPHHHHHLQHHHMHHHNDVTMVQQQQEEMMDMGMPNV
ncbi:hypothetical protein B566_EDAN003509 [Ephemera danica]|nr:hypothetical protein B566_EDAN003509 [Ephemera danica]